MFAIFRRGHVVPQSVSGDPDLSRGVGVGPNRSNGPLGLAPLEVRHDNAACPEMADDASPSR